MKLKATAASLLLLVVLWGASASAALTTTGTGGNLGFTMLNNTGDTSYVVDLGVDLATFRSAPAAFSTNVLSTINSALGTSLTDLSGYTWSVIGGVNNGTNLGYVGGFGNGTTPVGTGGNSSVLANQLNNLQNYWNLNSLTNDAASATSTDSGFWTLPNNWQGNFGGLSGASLFSLVGISQEAYEYFATGFDTFTANLLGGFNLDAAGNLTFSSAAPVPVPAAVWLFGSAMLGLVGFRKRQTASA